jgi:hypothetical protein
VLNWSSNGLKVRELTRDLVGMTLGERNFLPARTPHGCMHPAIIKANIGKELRFIISANASLTDLNRLVGKELGNRGDFRKETSFSGVQPTTATYLPTAIPTR